MTRNLIDGLIAWASLVEAGHEVPAAGQVMRNAAASIDALEVQNARLREATEWYGEQSRLARLVHSGGDAGRHAIAKDGGMRARIALGALDQSEPKP